MPDALPRIAWDNLMSSATLTANPATTVSGGGTVNLKDWTPWTFWRPTGAAPWTLEADFGATKTVTCFAVAGHDCLDTVAMDTWNGAAWVEFATTEAVAGGAVIYLTGDAVSTTKVRFRFDSLTFASVIFVGQDMILPEGIAGGWTDPLLAQRAKTTPEISRGGVFLGTAVELWDAELSLDIKAVEASWVRDTWMPFLRACSARPFLLSWNKDEWGGSACLCSNAKFGTTGFSQRGLCDVSVQFDADTGYDRRLTP